MKNRFKNLKDLGPEFEPMLDYFNKIDDSKFVMVVEYLSKGWGFGVRNHACSFENGVKFVNAKGLEGKSVILEYKEFYDYLKIACENYIKSCPDDETTILKYLQRFENEYIN